MTENIKLETAVKNKWALCVDDRFAVRAFISEALVSMGFRVHGAENGEQGLKLFEQYPFDLVITDCRMPGMDGLALASEIRKRNPEMPVILLSASSKEITESNIRLSGISKVLEKPLMPADFKKAVTDIFGKPGGNDRVEPSVSAGSL